MAARIVADAAVITTTAFVVVNSKEITNGVSDASGGVSVNSFILMSAQAAQSRYHQSLAEGSFGYQANSNSQSSASATSSSARNPKKGEKEPNDKG
ncbi:hypothetical protein I5907_07525 [Panacibacter sp. DH6]|uniref:Uncharacterized protein n=1 Tax=Panacibacter microcysteis TaxID=2793269 RepID=A0A931GXM1_9BACT|nr:hypothetical protein [Panacibacter microcysteis]MBG9376079.1 hypothetical protein [Panacibacter microcysteis]